MIDHADLWVEVPDQDIVVTMPGTSLRVVYRKRQRDRSSCRGSTIFKISRRAQSRGQSFWLALSLEPGALPAQSAGAASLEMGMAPHLAEGRTRAWTKPTFP